MGNNSFDDFNSLMVSTSFDLPFTTNIDGIKRNLGEFIFHYCITSA